MSTIDELEARVHEKGLELREAIEALVRSTDQPFIAWAPHLDPNQLVNCRVLPSRYHVVEKMKSHGVCVEVGTQTGYFARVILDKCHPQKLHLIDVDYSRFPHDKFAEEIRSGALILHEGDSSTVLDTFEDGSIDWIYVDGDHSYDGISKDLKVAKTKVRADGYIICNDYTVWSPGEVTPYGVMRAVNELCVQDDWEFVYFGLQGQGYHDVCIRKRVVA